MKELRTLAAVGHDRTTSLFRVRLIEPAKDPSIQGNGHDRLPHSRRCWRPCAFGPSIRGLTLSSRTSEMRVRFRQNADSQIIRLAGTDANPRRKKFFLARRGPE